MIVIEALALWSRELWSLFFRFFQAFIIIIIYYIRTIYYSHIPLKNVILSSLALYV